MATTDKSKPYIPLAGCANDGWSKEDEATATCFCGAVQLAFVSFTFFGPAVIGTTGQRDVRFRFIGGGHG